MPKGTRIWTRDRKVLSGNTIEGRWIVYWLVSSEGDGVTPHEEVAVTLDGASADGERTALIELKDGSEDGSMASRKDVNGCMVFRGGG